MENILNATWLELLRVLHSGWVLAGSLGHDAWIPVNTVDPSDHGSSAHGGQSQGGTYFGGAGGPRGSSDGQNPMHEGGQQPTAVCVVDASYARYDC